MFSPSDYQLLYGSESCGSYGAFGIKIMVASRRDGVSNLPNLDQPGSPVWNATYDAAEMVTAAVRTTITAADPKAQAARVAERAQIVGLFSDVGAIFVEEIPNGYCSDWCCKHLPWFVVTTRVGRFTVGWRKRVISIDWTATVGTKDSGALFAAEDVTKEERLIHAWTIEKARAYVNAIVASATA